MLRGALELHRTQLHLRPQRLALLPQQQPPATKRIQAVRGRLDRLMRAIERAASSAAAPLSLLNWRTFAARLRRWRPSALFRAARMPTIADSTPFFVSPTLATQATYWRLHPAACNRSLVRSVRKLIIWSI